MTAPKLTTIPLTILDSVVLKVNAGPCVTKAWEPVHLPELGDGEWCAAPVPYANWLIPGRLMIGETPGGDCYSNISAAQMQMELSQLVPGHVDTFVSLRGEWGPMERFMTKFYPEQLRTAELNCDCVFFPIEDFHVTHEKDVVAVVLDLRRRMRRGERLYIHCRSGHGRTGMICVPLVASLFNVSADEAAAFVQRAHDIGRNGGRDAGWSLPETREQRIVVEHVHQLVCQASIGAGGSSSSGRRARNT